MVQHSGHAAPQRVVVVQLRKTELGWAWRCGNQQFHRRPFDAPIGTTFSFNMPLVYTESYFLQDGRGMMIGAKWTPRQRGENYVIVWKRGGLKMPRKKQTFKVLVSAPAGQRQSAIQQQPLPQRQSALAQQRQGMAHPASIAALGGGPAATRAHLQGQ